MNSNPKNTDLAPLLLVDGSSYLYRAFHALPDLRTKSGQPTGAINGMVNMLRRLQKDYSESPIVVIFDAKGKTFRDDLYAEYKAQRPSMPDDLRAQIEPIHQLVEAMGFPMIIFPGVEADDVIGTLAISTSQLQRKVIIATGDKDMAQLVNPFITLYNPMNEVYLDRQGVIDKFGVPPELIIDYLAIIGDKSDNIPGVPGVGEKSAVPMLQALGDIESIYNNIEAVRELDFRGAKKMPERLLEHRHLADISKILATIKLDVAVDFDCLSGRNQDADESKLQELFQRYELNRLLKQSLESTSQGARNNNTKNQNEAAPDSFPTAPENIDYQCILNDADWQSWLQRLQNSNCFAFDTETTSLNCQQARIVGVSIALVAGEAAYIPFNHDYIGAPQQLDISTVLQDLKPLLEDPNIAIIGQNLKYDMSVLSLYKIAIKGPCFDTMIESYVLNAVGSKHDMNSMALRYLNHQCVSFSDIAGKGSKQLTFNQIDLDIAAHYAAEDADICWRLHQVFWPQVSSEPKLLSLYQNIEWPLVSVLSHIEMSGALVDAHLLGQQSIELTDKLAKLQQQVFELVGKEFNLSSPAQLQEILYTDMGIPVRKKTPKGQPSTAEEVLQDLARDYPLPGLILQYRSLAKLKSTYTDKLPKMIDADTGRIHTSYHQAVTATGRLSSSDPNLQNIPIRTDEGRRIRSAFIANKDHLIVAADYSQIELRIMAHLSEDPNLLSAFANGLDVHSATAAEVFDVAVGEVTKDQRRSAKAINFGLMYGMSAFGLAKQLNEGRQQAQAYIDRYFQRYPGVRQFMEQIRFDAKENGYVETLFGRRLPLLNINNSNANLRQGAERAAINAPMQGTAADIIKLAMIDINAWLIEAFPTTRLIMQVHDELVFEVPKQDVDGLINGVRVRMETVGSELLKVPLIVDINSGLNWNQAH